MASACAHIEAIQTVTHPKVTRLRRMREDRRAVGAPAHLPVVRRHTLLRFVAESPCVQARARQPASGGRLGGAGRALAVLLSGRRVRRILSVAMRPRTRPTGSPQAHRTAKAGSLRCLLRHPQRDDRIDARRAAGRDQAGDEAGRGQHQRHAGEHDRVERADAVEQTRHGARHRHRCDKAAHRSAADEQHASCRGPASACSPRRRRAPCARRARGSAASLCTTRHRRFPTTASSSAETAKAMSSSMLTRGRNTDRDTTSTIALTS